MFDGEIVTLRGVELSDLDAIMEHWNTAELRSYLHYPIPNSREEEEEWIRGTWEARKKGSAYQFIIEKKDTKEVLGGVGLMGVDSINRTAELGIAIYAKKNWGKGYGTDAMKVILKFGFDILNLNRIQLRVYDFNIRGQKCYKKVGFTEVGRFRKAAFKDGKYHDVIFMDILRDEWKEKNQG